MSFKPKQSLTDSDIREQQSVDFVVDMLKGYCVNPKLEKREKGANIDGYIELLDENRCINGKITVQVKTVRPDLEGKYKFPCPTSLFAYAERTMDVVFLVAVDHREKIVLWKYISQSLIDENLSKSNQETITLHFNESERLNSDNVQQTLDVWSGLFLQERNLYKEATAHTEENERLRKELIHAESVAFDLPKSEITKIQCFSDLYNTLLDRELLPVKHWCYPDSWKQGFAIHIYTENQLYYSRYSIHYGENSLLIKQLPVSESGRSEFKSARMSFIGNDMREDFRSLVKKMIKDDVQRFAGQKDIPPFYDYYLIEYVRDFILSNRLILKIDPSLLQDYNRLIEHIQQHYATESGKVVPYIWKNRPIQMGILYELTKHLLGRGYVGDTRLYPSKGHYADTGFVWDWFSPDLAFNKMQFVVDYVYKTYTNYICKNFSWISSRLDMFENADRVLINLSYTNKCQPHIRIHCFFRDDNPTSYHQTKIDYSLNRSCSLYKQIEEPDNMRLVGKSIQIEGVLYECRISTSLDIQDVLFSNTCLIDTFRSVLKKRLNDFVEQSIK